MNPTEPARETLLWIDGWYQFASKLVSPNFGPRPGRANVDLIVLHSISLPPGEYGGDEVQRLFTNQLDWDQHTYFKSIQGMEVSAHFYIRRNGELWQFVSANDRAWHAGASRYRGRSNCNDDSIGIELEGIEGGLFEDSQYETLAVLCAAIWQHYPIVHIAGHEHVAPGRKADPGDGFNWLRLQQSLGLAARHLPHGAAAKSARPR
jgi:AmpD protein